ncbi:MAG: major capsid protein [Rhodospirillaceae bacterium]|nr:major capsid protein [Rhodospirillaceae bacterium]
MSLRQVRVIDPVLSSVAIGYSNPAFMVPLILPRVPVFAAGGQIIEFGKEAFLSYNLRRAPGGGTKRVALGYTGKPYALVQDALEIPIPFEHQRDAEAVVGINLQTNATKKGMSIALKSLEVEGATLVTTLATYAASNRVTLAGGTKWSAGTGVPVTDFDTGREAIRSQCGVYPNTAWFSPVAWNAFKNNPQVVDRFKYTNPDGMVSPEMAKGILQVDNVYVGAAISMTDAGVASDIWGNNAGLCYVPPVPEDADTPGFGFTYAMDGDPRVEEIYADRPNKSWIVPVTYERAPVIAAASAGYLFQSPN